MQKNLNFVWEKNEVQSYLSPARSSEQAFESLWDQSL
jgi:hypothetical protein